MVAMQPKQLCQSEDSRTVHLNIDKKKEQSEVESHLVEKELLVAAPIIEEKKQKHSFVAHTRDSLIVKIIRPNKCFSDVVYHNLTELLLCTTWYTFCGLSVSQIRQFCFCTPLGSVKWHLIDQVTVLCITHYSQVFPKSLHQNELVHASPDR